MSINYSSPLMMKLRRAGQQLGVLRPMVRLYRRAFRVSYEEQFDREILQRIAAGDVVWDVGANVGYFTSRFSDKVGSRGRVLAFEPSPRTFAALKAACGDRHNVELVNVALADRDGMAQFHESGSEADPTNGFFKPGAGSASIGVPVQCGDSFCAGRRELIPARIKIDVEGYELEVLRGLGETLCSPAVKDVFVEVHFQVLASRGLADAPASISRLFAERGFTVRWVDPSHLIASRDA